MAEGMGFSNSCLLEVRTPLDKPEEHRYGIHQKPASRCLDTRSLGVFDESYNIEEARS